MCACSPARSWLHPKLPGQELKGGDSAALLPSDEPSPGALHPSQGDPSIKKTGTCWKESRGEPQRWSEGHSTPVVKTGSESWDHGEAAFQYLRGYKKAGKLFSRACIDRTRENSFKLRLCLNEKKGRIVFMIKVVRHWVKLPGEVVEGISLEML